MILIVRAIQIIVQEYQRARLVVKEMFDLYGYEYEAAIEENDLIGLIESDNEGGIIAAGLQLLTKYQINAIQVPAGEHVGYVERPIRTIKRRVNAMQMSIEYKLTPELLKWLVIDVVNWNNLFPKKNQKYGPWTNVYYQRLTYTDVTRAPYESFVMAYRPVKQIIPGQGYGEMGISLGFNPRFPGSIHFMSLETGHVKTRSRFTVVTSINGIEKFGVNKYYVPPNPIRTLKETVFKEYDRNHPAYSPEPEYSPDEKAVKKEEHHEESQLHDALVQCSRAVSAASCYTCQEHC